MSENRTRRRPWLHRQLLLVLGLTPISMVLVKLVWMTTLSELYGTLNLLPWLALSVVLSAVMLFYLSTDAL